MSYHCQINRSRVSQCYSNFQRVAFPTNSFSHKPNTTRGRTANIGSFIERMSCSMPFMSNLYLRSYARRNLRRAVTSAISATPSTITASFASSVHTTQLAFCARLRALRDLLPVLNSNRPSCHKPQTTMVCGETLGTETLGVTVVIQ